MSKKINKKTILITIAMVMVMVCSINLVDAFASDIGSTKLVTGTKNLITSTTTALTGLGAAVTTVLAIIKGLQWQTADDQEKPGKKKSFISVIIIGIVITTISGVITAVLAFYA